jgi:hypothetical protein
VSRPHQAPTRTAYNSMQNKTHTLEPRPRGSRAMMRFSASRIASRSACSKLMDPPGLFCAQRGDVKRGHSETTDDTYMHKELVSNAQVQRDRIKRACVLLAQLDELLSNVVIVAIPASDKQHVSGKETQARCTCETRGNSNKQFAYPRQHLKGCPLKTSLTTRTHAALEHTKAEQQPHTVGRRNISKPRVQHGQVLAVAAANAALVKSACE